jgi:hypothetical protein
VDAVWAVVKRRYGRMLLTTLGLTFVLAAPIVIVLIPCLGALAYLAYVVYAGPVFSLAYPMRMARDDLGFWAALGRCRDLAREAFWQTFGVVVLAYIIYGVLGSIFSMPASVLGMVRAMHSLDGGSSLGYDIAFFALSLASGAASTVLYCIPLVAIALQYYNLLEQREHAGLMRRVASLDDEGETTAAATGAPADALRTDRGGGGEEEDDVADDAFAEDDFAPDAFAAEAFADDDEADDDGADVPDDFADAPGDAGPDDFDDDDPYDDGADLSRWSRR